MFYFEGCSCSFCGEKFTQTDDIVACPVCGSPHHRSCYNENSGCANAALHEEDFSWKRDSASAEGSEGESSDAKVTFCGVCGAENSAGRLYCHNCGRALFDDTVGEGEGQHDGYNRQAYDFSDKEAIGDVPLNDIKRFLGPSSAVYVPLFYRMHKSGQKVSFDLFGLLFPWFWLINHKMYFRGVLMLLFNLASYCYCLLFYGVYNQFYEAAMTFNSEMVMEVFNKQPMIVGGFFAFGIISAIISVVVALFGSRMYMKWVLRRIRRIRKKNPETEAYHAALQRNSTSGCGASLMFLLIYFAATLAAEKFLPMLM